MSFIFHMKDILAGVVGHRPKKSREKKKEKRSKNKMKEQNVPASCEEWSMLEGNLGVCLECSNFVWFGALIGFLAEFGTLGKVGWL